MRLEDHLAQAFDLGRPISGLMPVQHTTYETFRLDTDRGSFLVKCLWRKENPDWGPSIAESMDYERRATEAGIRTARPVMPIEPSFGCAARIGDHGTFRVHEWIDHEKVTRERVDDLIGWAGETLARLHTLQPLGKGAEPAWQWWGVRTEETWDKYEEASAAQRKPWATLLQERREDIRSLTRRLVRAWHDVGDPVISHGDFATYNILLSAEGPVLIDWDSVGITSATFEVGLAARGFFFDDSQPAKVRQIFDAYLAAGGKLRGKPENYFTNFLSIHFNHICDRIEVSLGEAPRPGWMAVETIDQRVQERLGRLPRTIDELSALGIAATD